MGKITSHGKIRYPLIDYLRCLAIVLMIIFHFCYDLGYLHVVSRESVSTLPFIIIARSCLCLFLFCVGYSLALNRKAHTDLRSFLRSFSKNWLKVSIGAATVSAVTFIAVPQHWVYFGILHCISIGSLIALGFLSFPKCALVIGTVMMGLYWGWDWRLPWLHLPQPSLDYIPVFPWLGMILVGIAAESWQWHKRIQLPSNKIIFKVSKHSLLIYLVHQPLLVALIWLYLQVR